MAKELTQADKSDRIWRKLKIEAEQVGHGSLQVKLIICNGLIVEAIQTLGEKRHRAD